MLTRRDLLKAGALGLVGTGACRPAPRSVPDRGVVLNDVHSKLNRTRVASVVRPAGLEELQAAIGDSANRSVPVSIAGGRHAMGGQQFGAGTLHVDTLGLDRVLDFDSASGLIEVEAGAQWPGLIEECARIQEGAETQWGIAQKQTGADRLSLGGALASNVHGRGLTLAPFVGDIESFTLVDAGGGLKTCSRTENAELFRLAVGGYGLFGVVYSIRLRLSRRQLLERVVEVLPIDEVADMVESRIGDGYLYGDFQFKTAEASPDFLQRGVFSCYRPKPADTLFPHAQRSLSDEDWLRLLDLAHVDKARAFDEYAAYYLKTNGQIYWTDTHQLSFYSDDYHVGIDARTGSAVPATEMISEVYVPRTELATFLAETAETLREIGANVIYGTVRWVEPDTETFLPWARERYASIVFNLHVGHSREGIARARREFRTLIDLARKRRGSYFLTYHRWATREQVDDCYPEMAEFLAKKLEYDPGERFQSNWYRHYRSMYSAPR